MGHSLKCPLGYSCRLKGELATTLVPSPCRYMGELATTLVPSPCRYMGELATTLVPSPCRYMVQKFKDPNDQNLHPFKHTPKSPANEPPSKLLPILILPHLQPHTYDRDFNRILWGCTWYHSSKELAQISLTHGED